MTKTTELTLVTRSDVPTTKVKAYLVMPGLYAHRNPFGQGWQLSHHSGWGIGCYTSTLRECREYADKAQTHAPIDWTLPPDDMKKDKAQGGRWGAAFKRLDLGLEPYDDDEDDFDLDKPYDTTPLTWDGMEVYMPTYREVRAWIVRDHVCEALDGCDVEPDGHCSHGAPSYLLALGCI